MGRRQRRAARAAPGTRVAMRCAFMQRGVLDAVELWVHGAGGIDVGRISSTFPTVRVVVGRARDRGDTEREIDCREQDWHAAKFDFWAFDRRVDAAADAGRPLRLASPARHASRFVIEALTRAQRRADRRNVESRSAFFDRLLEGHRALHDLSVPLVRADYDHALDTWQWLLRLEPSASAACQAAALLHDVERLDTEAEARTEQHAPDYRAYKEAHARAGAGRAAALVRSAGGGEALAREVGALVAESEASTGGATDCARLNDADALSFFSLNSPGFFDYFGAAHARKKVAYTIARMSARALAELPRIRLRPDVASVVAETLEAPLRPVQAFG